MYDICRKVYFSFREQIVHQLGCQNDNADHNENHQHTDTHVPQFSTKAMGLKSKLTAVLVRKFISLTSH